VQQTPYHIPVPPNTAAVVAISKKGGIRVIAVHENGNSQKPSVCDIKGPNQCPFLTPGEIPKPFATVEIIEVIDKPVAEEYGGGDVALLAANQDKKCVFVIKVGNKLYYYVAPCTP